MSQNMLVTACLLDVWLNGFGFVSASFSIASITRIIFFFSRLLRGFAYQDREVLDYALTIKPCSRDSHLVVNEVGAVSSYGLFFHLASLKFWTSLEYTQYV